MLITLKNLYKRFNQYGEYYSYAPIMKSVTMAKIYRDYSEETIDIEKIIHTLENCYWNLGKEKKELFLDSNAIQPKSTGFRLLILRVVLDAIPESVFLRMDISKNDILGITNAIVLYYLGLHTEMFSELKMDSTQKRNLLGSVDFSFCLRDIQLVRGVTDEESFFPYMKLFSEDINELSDENACLFNDHDRYFIFCAEDFVDFTILRIEREVKKVASNQEINLYTKKKGELFELLTSDIVKAIGDEVYHTVYYYPNNKQRMELDVVSLTKQDIAVFECKSGTFDISGIEQDDVIKLQIRNKVKKAYKTLSAASDYLKNNQKYLFECGESYVEGEVYNSFLIHVFMYPMDFIASNIHALFKEYYNEQNPILSISLEHLFAMIIDARRNGISLFDYWKRRKEYIKKYPGLFFDNNELDLYYDIMINKDSMLNEMVGEGILDSFSPECILTSTFHNQYGDEVRPARRLIQQLDTVMLYRIVREGKRECGLNKRYLKNLEDYLSVK